MARTDERTDLEALLAHGDWLRRMAAGLVRGADAEDLAQEAWIAAMRSPPDVARPARPWLAEVLRNLARMRARAAARRARREEGAALEAAALARAVAPSPDELLERLRVQRLVGELLAALEEPYRTALLLRYVEGRPGDEIARALGVPPGTARWRIAEGLRRLRARLDERESVGRWRAMLAPLVPGARAPEDGAAAAPALPGLRPLPLAAAGSAVAGIGLAVWLLGGAGQAPRGPAPLTPLAAAAPTPLPSASPPNEENATMTRTRKNSRTTGAAALFGVALPALVAGAEAQDRSPTRQEGITACVEFKEKTVRCKAELADYFATFAPAEHREKLRRKAAEEIEEEGTGPLAPREAKCAAAVDGTSGKAEYWSAMRPCSDEPDCAKVVTCASPIMNAWIEASKARKPRR